MLTEIFTFPRLPKTVLNLQSDINIAIGRIIFAGSIIDPILKIRNDKNRHDMLKVTSTIVIF